MRKLIASLALACALALSVCNPGLAQGVSPAQMFGCNQSAIYDASTNGSTKLVTGVAGKQIYVCGWNILAAGTASVKFIYGTGGTCGTGTTSITPAFQFTTQVSNIDHPLVYTGLLPAPALNDVCINASAGVAVQAILYYTQF